MYTFINAICLSRSIGSQWHEVDLTDILVYDIYVQYSKVYLILHNDILETDVNVDFDSLKIQYSSYNGTLSELLISLGNIALTTVETIPSTEVKYAKYSDAFRSKYKIDIARAGIVTPDSYPVDDMHDLMITRPGFSTDVSLLHSHCLLSVNGFYHMTDADDSKAYVYNGADTMRKGRNNQLGILSFLDVGALTKIKLQKDNIVGQTAESPLSEKIYFSVSEDLDNKSYILVLGGYLVFPETDIFWRNGTHSFALDLNRLRYLERIYEASLYMDMSALGLTSQSFAPDAINVQEVWSDAIIKNYLTLSQSYLVLVDIPYLLTNKIHLRHASLPGMFTAYQNPVYPLIVNDGKVAEYWKVHEDGHWAVSVQDSFYRNYILSQQATTIADNINNHLVPNKPFHHSRGYLLEIAGYHV